MRVERYRDRPAHTQAVECFDQGVGPEPGAGPDSYFTGRSGSAGPAYGLGGETGVVFLGCSVPEAGGRNLPAPGPAGRG